MSLNSSTAHCLAANRSPENSLTTKTLPGNYLKVAFFKGSKLCGAIIMKYDCTFISVYHSMKKHCILHHELNVMSYFILSLMFTSSEW